MIAPTTAARFTSIDELRSQIGGHQRLPVEYVEKQIHDIPHGEIVKDRNAWVVARVTGKRVLDIGASGRLHEQVVKVAAMTLGIDREAGPITVGFDLDDVSKPHLPYIGVPFDVVLCGEVLEHLSNPGHFLSRLKKEQYGVPVIITVPSAFRSMLQSYQGREVENVNKDHVSWFSPRTLKTLVERAGYRITEFAYYNGEGPAKAEGLIAVVE